MYWADELAQKIIDSGKHKPYWVDDMKTPSGRVHIGSVRTIMTHELIYRALKDKGVEVTFSYVFEDHDPFDKIPHYLDENKFREHLGKPLYEVPSPDEGYDNYGQRWAMEYKQVLESLGIKPKIIWGSELYKSGKMNDMVRMCLDKAAEIRKIYGELYGEPKPDNWFPFQPKCPKCGKISTTVVSAWDGVNVEFECKQDAVDFTNGCGFKGKQSPFDGNGKMPWKVEWPCKWKVVGVTVEGAGKDHMSAGGSHDFAKLMCERVIDYPVPFGFSHEFFLIGGKKMSSSKGTGASAKEIAELLPPELMRFVVTRVKYTRAINFNPEGETIPKLYDDYDRAARAFWGKTDERLARVFELSQVESTPEAHYLPRFSDVVKFVQDAKIDVYKKFAALKGEDLTKLEKQVLAQRVEYAKLWLKDYAPQDEVFIPTDKIPDEVKNLNNQQKEFLVKVGDLLSGDVVSPEELQTDIYYLIKELGIPSKDAFQAIYLSLIGKTHGPKAAWFLIEYKNIATKRFSDIVNS